MNINININTNQGVININSVEFTEEFTANTSKNTENTKDRENKEKNIVWEQKEGNITPAYTPSYGNVGKSGIVPQRENAVVVGDKKDRKSVV